VRVDSCLFSGLDIPQYYDSMLAKAIAWGSDRPEAISRLSRALAEYTIVGPRTTVPFHIQLLQHEEFLQGRLDTRFIDTRFKYGEPDIAQAEEAALLIAAVMAHRRQKSGKPSAAVASTAASTATTGWKMAGRLAAMSTPIGGGPWRSSS
jgi:acetyl-CoA carboxylase biotin carboxylase subunit